MESGYNPGRFIPESSLLIAILHLPLNKEFLVIVIIITDEETESQQGKYSSLPKAAMGRAEMESHWLPMAPSWLYDWVRGIGMD